MWSPGAETKLSHLEGQPETFRSVSVGQTEFSERSSVSWRTVEVQMESVSSVKTCSQSHCDLKPPAGPQLLTEMSDVRVKSGDKAEFSCLFKGQPFTVVEWDHNGQSLAETDRVRSSATGGLLSLVIQGVGVADQGVYCCTATNRHGHNRSSAQLTVEG